MSFDPAHILAILDACAESSTFPMLDNGYVYLGATRLSLHRSMANWAIVIEVFGFSPRAGLPDLHIYTFANHLHARNPVERYVSQAAYERYIAHNPHNEGRFFYPIQEGSWLDTEDQELVAPDASEVMLRGQVQALPALDQYATYDIALETPPRVQVFELCRWLSAIARDQVLATPQERRVSVAPDSVEILRLEAWHHPDIAGGEQPSASQTFQQLAFVLSTGDVTAYRPLQSPNTHWRNWPDGGRL